MPTQRPTRRVRDEVAALAGFPPEGLSEPFKLDPVTWTQRFPLGTGGVNRLTPADSLQPDQAFTLENFKINMADIEPSWGYSELGTPKASPQEITCLVNYKESDGTAYLVAIDEDELRYWDGSTWTTVTGSGWTVGTEANTIRASMVLDNLVFVNGADNARDWQGGATFGAVAGSPPNKPHFVCGFADRMVIAVVGSTTHTQRIDWSVSGDHQDWSGTGAGGVHLYDSQESDPSDDIMGLLKFSNFLVIPRRRSIWLGVRTGNVDAPIEFASHVQGYGVSASDSVQVLGTAGIAFLGHDFNVYLYHPQKSEPLPIGLPIHERIKEVLDETKLTKVRSAYVPETQEYWLLIPDSVNTWGRRAFVFNLQKYTTGELFVWSERLFTNDITAMVAGQTAGLGATFTQRAKKLIVATSAGEVFAVNSSDTTNDGTSFTATFESPQFNAGRDQIQVVKLNLAYRAGGSTTVTITTSTDGGTTYANSASYALSATDEIREVGLFLPAGVYGRSFMFKLTTSGASDVNLVGYRIGFVKRGDIYGV